MERLNVVILRGVALPTAIAGLAIAGLAWMLSGVGASVAALAGTGVVVIFFSAGQLLLGSVLRRNPAMGLSVAMLLYLVKIGVLLGLLILLGDATFLDSKAFAFTILADTLMWTGLEVWAFSRMKVLYVDPANPAPGFPVPTRSSRDAGIR